ncbi:MAG: acyl carrier protein [Cyanobacteria bacterium M_surface_7_m2_040]|nr:acyl carrier protein [Cyanobacteria bacterium M_surface_7_m2_040]
MVEAVKLSENWSEAEALDVLRDLLHKTCGIEPASIQLGSSLVKDLNIDSLGMMEAIIEAEDAFGVSIDAGELSPTLTIQGLINILSAKGVIKR